MELGKPIMQGILSLPPQGMLGQLKKTWHKKYCLLFNSSKHGIERVEIYDNHKEAMTQAHSPRIITLEACIKITASCQPYGFTVFTKSGSYHFGCSSELDMNTWINSFQSVAFKDDSSTQTIEEDNDLYSSSSEGIFSVKLVETDASQRCNLESKNYTLIVAAMELKLMSGDKILYTWPYPYIKRYGHKDGKFTFEAGRKCKSGEGSFHFQHGNRQEIFRCVASKMESIKRQLIVDNIQNIECNDTQYHAALSMEAGSRSPLPPSPNSSKHLIDVDFSTISQTNQKHSNSSSSSLESISYNKSLPPTVVRPTPAKPPRKSLLTNFGEKLVHKSESTDSFMINDNKTKMSIHRESPEIPTVSARSDSPDAEEEDEDDPYDLVEFKNNAMKSYVTEVVEKFSTLFQKGDKNSDDNHPIHYESIRPVTMVENTPKSLTTTSPIIHNVSNKTSDSQNYDKLQHFGSTHRLNHNPVYRTPSFPLSSSSSPNPYSTIALNTQTESNQATSKSNTTWYSYKMDEDMSAVRLANDNHGYGIIKKRSSPPTPTSLEPRLTIYNNTEYAIVSKPKRV